MPNIKKINLLGQTYDIIDATALHDANAFDAANSAAQALTDAKSYTDNKISALGNYLTYKGSKNSEAEIKAITSAKVGDVWLNSDDGSEWVCIVAITDTANANAWEKLGYTISAASPTHTHTVTVDQPTSYTQSVYSMSSDGSVVAGTAASFTRGSFNGGSFTQGKDIFAAGTTPCVYTYNESAETLTISNGTAPSFTQGVDNFTAATHADDVFSANTPTVVTLPSRTEIKDLWKGKTTKSYDTSAPV